MLGAWTKSTEVLNGARRIISEKLKENHYREGDVRCIETKRVEWDKESNDEHLWQHVKRGNVDKTREVYGPVRVGRKNLKMRLTERMRLRRMCYALKIRLQKKDGWKFIKKKEKS